MIPFDCSAMLLVAHVPQWLRDPLRLVTSADVSFHIRFQNNCVVVLRIVGAIHQCDSATAGGFEDRLHSLRVSRPVHVGSVVETLSIWLDHG